jgi:hypothetical protein
VTRTGQPFWKSHGKGCFGYQVLVGRMKLRNIKEMHFEDMALVKVVII